MDLEVVGRHALLFDDDATSAFVNSNDALVEWNSLRIDRYDVRHLLPTPLPPLKRRRHSSASSAEVSQFELELDQERFLDLPPPSEEQELDNSLERADGGGYHAVAFSYGNPDDSADKKNADAGSGCVAFHPPFSVPENLLNNLPPTEKLHQIIARTAIFVGKHGGQSEIVLRVKQGDNPTFGFLMPDHHLHKYFRFLVDHKELLEPDLDGKSEEEKKANTEHSQIGGVGEGGALSLLGSVYGSGEDEDGAANIDSSESQENDHKETSPSVHTVVSHGSEGTTSAVNMVGNNEAIPKHLPPKEKVPASKRNRVSSAIKGGTASSMKKKSEEWGLLAVAMDKSQTSALPSSSKVKTLVLEPPSDLKRLVDKIVEFILKNGKEFEAVLVEQDTKHGRFPFLLPSNQYYPYYLQVLQKAHETKLTGKNTSLEKDGADKKTALSKENDSVSLGSSCHDIPYDSDRKEKFKMVLGKSKKDGQDQPSKPTQQQIGVSVDTAAAILQAATRGIKNPNLDILPRTSWNGVNHGGLSSEGGQASSFHGLFSSQPQSSSQRSDLNGGPSVSVPVAKAIANTAALAAASEADSSEAHLTKEQKLKAERLKRAKMFAAIIKSGAAPLKTELVRGLSVEPPESGASGLAGEHGNLTGKERAGSSVPVDVDTSDKNEKPERKYSDTEYNERRSKRRYRSRSKKYGEEEDDDDNSDEDGKEEDEKEGKRDRKHSRKKHRSHHSSSHRSRDKHKDKKRRSSSSKDRESRHRHKHEYSDDEHLDRRKRSKRSRSEREADLEEGEISAKSSDQSKASVDASREASLDVSNSYQDGRAQSQPSHTAEVSDDLRAKIRAMLLATL